MPIDPGAAQLAQIMQQLQQAGLMQNAQASGQNPFKQQAPPQSKDGGLNALLGQLSQPGQSPLTQLTNTAQQQPQTLGIQRPIPMQMPQADPQGQQAPEPNDPFAAGLSGQ